MIKRGGGRLITGTIIFVDIRGFTNISEKAGGPSEVVDLLNDYFERVSHLFSNSIARKKCL
jgi:class 3 adenylate cyclase